MASRTEPIEAAWEALNECALAIDELTLLKVKALEAEIVLLKKRVDEWENWCDNLHEWRYGPHKDPPYGPLDKETDDGRESA